MEYGSPREYLDDIIALVERMLERAQLAARAVPDSRALAECDLDLTRREEAMVARCAATAARSRPLPLDRVRAVFGLSPTEGRMLEVLAALELSPRVREAAGGLLAGPTANPTIGLIEALVYRSARERLASPEELADDGRIFAHELADLGGDDLPWLARPVRVARRVLELALGRFRLDPDVARRASLTEPPSGEHLLVDPKTRALVYDAIHRQRALPSAPIALLVGPSGSGRAALALAAAAEAGTPALVVRAGDLPRSAPELAHTVRAMRREAILFGALLVVRDLDALAGSIDDPAARAGGDLVALAASLLTAHGGPVAVTATRNVWPVGGARPIVVAELGVPSEAERAALWLRELGAAGADLANDAASRYRITGGIIERAAANARGHAAGRGATVELADIRVGVRGQLDAELATLGHRIEWQQTWEDLVLPRDLIHELRELIGRVRHRRRVLDEWGFARKVGKGTGISALFSGPPGTGKTMVAGLVARELELDLYQIDVSRMVSKWIGETEKNLARLFDAAAAGHAILLFDEADSLFSRRTDVKSSTDRYANLEVNYLLQRMESFEGITILTTNLAHAVDEAFRRRLAFQLAFPVPDADERLHLWQALLPAEAQIAPGVQFKVLAERFEMSGGYIRNAVLRAAYLAAAAGTAITQRHLERAAILEYTAMGKIIHHSL